MSKVEIDLELVTKAFVDALKGVEKLTEKFSTNVDDSFKNLSKSMGDLDKSIANIAKTTGKGLGGVGDKLGEVGGAADDLGKKGKKGFGSFGDAFNVMAGTLAANAVTFAITSIKNSLSNVIREAIETEEAINSLNTALKLSGDYSEETSSQMQDYAKSLSNVTTYDDDLIIKNQALLVSLTKLSGDGINQAIKAAVDLSAVLGKDLDTTTTMVAKAINGSTESFEKLGIHIEKSKVASEQFNNVMSALSSFSGTAESKTRTFSGAIEQGSVAFNNMLSALGQVLTTSPAVIGVLNSMTVSIQNISKFLEDNKTTIQAWMSGFVSAIDTIAGAFSILATPFKLYSEANRALYEFSEKASDAVSGQASNMSNLTNITSEATTKNNEFINSLLVGATTQNTFQQSLVAANETKKQSIIVTRELTAAQLEQQAADLAFTTQLATNNAVIAEDYKLKLEALTGFYTEKEMLDTASETVNFDAKRAREQQYTTDRNALLNQQLADEKRKVQNSIATEQQKRDALSQLQKRYDSAYQANANEHSKRVLEIDKYEKDQKRRSDETAVQDRDKTLNLFASMSENSSKELQAIGKAAAIAQIAYQAPSAIASAFAFGTATGGPILGGVFAGIAAVAMGAQAAAIGAAKPPAPKTPKVPEAKQLSKDEVSLKQTELDILQAESIVSKDTTGQVATRIEELNKRKDELERLIQISRLSEELKAAPKFATGGIVSGSSFSGDRVTAQLNSGEMVLNRTQQSNLFNQINSGSGNSGRVEALLVNLIDAVKSKATTSVNINGREIINVVRNGLDSGRSLA